MSTELLSRRFLQEVEDLVFEMLVDFEDEMVDALVDNKGLSYGDESVSRDQRILKFLDVELRGVNDAMGLVDPGRHEKQRSGFVDDVEAEGLS